MTIGFPLMNSQAKIFYDVKQVSASQGLINPEGISDYEKDGFVYVQFSCKRVPRLDFGIDIETIDGFLVKYRGLVSVKYLESLSLANDDIYYLAKYKKKKVSKINDS